MISRCFALIFICCLTCSTAVAATDMVYPPIGIPWSWGSQWGGSYTVGTGPNNLLQLDARGRLPAIDGSLLYNLPDSGNTAEMVYPPFGIAFSTGTAWGGSYAVGTNPSNLVQLNSSGGLPELNGVLLKNLTNISYRFFSDSLLPGQIAMDTAAGMLMFHPGLFPVLTNPTTSLLS